MRRKRQCRLWWPTDLSSQSQLGPCLLFGWFIPSSESSLDVVVAFACDQLVLSSIVKRHSSFQEILQGTSKSLPAVLQEKCKFSLLGYYESDLNVNGKTTLGVKNRSSRPHATNHLNAYTSNHTKWSCGCAKHDSSVEQDGLADSDNMSIKLVYGLSETSGRRIHVIPKLDHLHWNMETMFELDLHVIVYEVPKIGSHHYAVGIQGLSNLREPLKMPKWFSELHQRDAHLDLDTVIRAINCAGAAQRLFGRNYQAESRLLLKVVCMFTNFVWGIFALFAASLSTVIYILLQSSHTLLRWISDSYVYIVLGKIFSNTWQNIHVRCCQLLYWPIFLQGHTTRYQSCVEFAEKDAFHKHSVWSNIVVDVLLGNLLGVALWSMTEPACLWVSNISNDITNYWFRNGCVWLMGNPAGFKVNTELAGVLGMFALTAIQIWSTLWGLVGLLVIHFARGLALCGMIFGLTAAAALIIDLMSLVTMHVLGLHLFLSLLYSTQIMAVAALWRLFRGRKWNPLRLRLDSYEYTVEQHVVGSLLFTPLILLLPTTSAFYIFFTILHTFVCLFCLIFEVAISLVHCTPFAKVFVWFKSKKRFPSGIWFEVLSCQQFEIGAVDGSSSSTGNMQKIAFASHGKSTVLVSYIRSNYLNLGEVVWPHYKCLFSAFSRSSIGSSAYGILAGRSTPYPQGACLPQKLPWIVIPWKDYWILCHDAVYACRTDPYNHLHW